MIMQTEFQYCVWGVSNVTGQMWLLWRCDNFKDAELLSAMESDRILSPDLSIVVYDADGNSYEENDEFVKRDRAEWNLLLASPALAWSIMD
jgi:hypothetical protein